MLHVLPVGGTQDWYLPDKGDATAAMTVKTVGFYKDLFQPKGA
ncbi:hypothetical protein [Sphingobium sp. Z007]|nr:hypothetical protein [Sphingobium sp. Z007]